MDSKLLYERYENYGCDVIKISRTIEDSDEGWILKKQLVRSGTSVALNYAEARGTFSKKEFAYKISIVLRELKECKMNLKILERNKMIPIHSSLSFIQETEELTAMTYASLKRLKESITN